MYHLNLCIEDDADICEMLAALLSRRGYEVVCAETAEKAASLIKNQSFSLYILDGQLSGCSGTNLCRVIRSQFPKIPIVFFSDLSKPKGIKRAIEAGANDYFLKKQRVEPLIETINSLLNPPKRDQTAMPLKITNVPDNIEEQAAMNQNQLV